MALIKCPECGREISDKAEACPNCAYPIANINKNNAVAQKESHNTDAEKHIGNPTETNNVKSLEEELRAREERRRKRQEAARIKKRKARRKKIIVISSIAVVLVAITAFFIFYGSTHFNAPEEPIYEEPIYEEPITSGVEESISSSEDYPYMDTFEDVLLVIKDKGEAIYGNDINNPTIEGYQYRDRNSAEFLLYVDATGEPEKRLTYTYVGDVIIDENVFPSGISYVVTVVLYADGSTSYKISYFSTYYDDAVLKAEIEDINNSEYVDATTPIKITSYDINHTVVDAPVAQKFFLNGLHRDCIVLNSKLSEIFGVTLKDFGYTKLSID